jgi:hypothetical protein
MIPMIWYLLVVAYPMGFPEDIWQMPLLGLDIRMGRVGKPNDPVLLYNMHDNENTSAYAGRIISLRYGGEYFELIHTGKRNLSFLHGEDSVHVDPNRIYTDAGIWQQLAKNKVTDTVIFEAIRIWKDSILQRLNIRGRELVIALHNNSDENYSLHSYLIDGEYVAEAEAVFYGSYPDEDDFFFVTDMRIMEKLATGRYHVILQNNSLMTDDGSLSVYCAQQGIPYVNVETQHGHLVRQLQMLIVVFQRLLEKG